MPSVVIEGAYQNDQQMEGCQRGLASRSKSLAQMNKIPVL